MTTDKARPYNGDDIHHYTMKVGNGVLKIDYKTNLSITIQCTLPDILYGNNYHLVNIEEAARAIDLITQSTGLDFESYFLCRIDMTAMLDLPFDLMSLSKVVRSPKHHSRLYVKEKGIGYATGKEGSEKRDRQLVFYNKVHQENANGVVRVEARLKSGSKIKENLKHDCLISELTKDSFYQNCALYLKRVTGEATRLHKNTDYARAIITALDDAIASTKVEQLSSKRATSFYNKFSLQPNPVWGKPYKVSRFLVNHIMSTGYT